MITSEIALSPAVVGPSPCPEETQPRLPNAKQTTARCNALVFSCSRLPPAQVSCSRGQNEATRSRDRDGDRTTSTSDFRAVYANIVLARFDCRIR